MATTKESKAVPTEISALEVPQWLAKWDDIKWNPGAHRRKPPASFYVFSMSAAALRSLCGVYPRTTAERSRGTQDLGTQRRHDPERSKEIAAFIKFGYPWSDLSEAKRKSGEYQDLRMPGWLPTAIVVNILGPKDERRGQTVATSDLVKVSKPGGRPLIHMPASFQSVSWRSQTIPPIEVIDGQHRLWAFEEANLDGEFQLPVVAFHELDISWVAYLFYTINIKPKRINASLAFDLYPLLRTEDWLQKFEGPVIYREARAQELVDLLWSCPQSPWHKRINMLGEPGAKGLMVSQAAWIRSLLATFIKSWESPRSRIGGLFGAPVGSDEQALPWSRAEQAAVLIAAGTQFREAVAQSKANWATVLRKQKPLLPINDAKDMAFFGPNTLINQDQGIRAFLYVVNDLCYMRADKLALSKWGQPDTASTDIEVQVSKAMASLKKTGLGEFLETLSQDMASFDWRASDAPELSQDQRLLKAAYRGSGGYKELRQQLLNHLASGKGDIAKAAAEVKLSLGYK